MSEYSQTVIVVDLEYPEARELARQELLKRMREDPKPNYMQHLLALKGLKKPDGPYLEMLQDMEEKFHLPKILKFL